jgi:2-(1,2-epoxy-1,2-dihydrophenyl)acetyl-CoA isomerase
VTGFETIRLEVEDGIAVLTLDRPDRLNALTPRLFAESRQAIDHAIGSGARCLLITGAGRAFCSGADLQGDEGEGLPTDLGELLDTVYNPFFRYLAALPIPIVTAVNGIAAGAGCSLALAGDFVLAARSASFLLAFVNIGLVPDGGMTWLLPRLIGRQRALDMMMLGERVGAEKAESWGMIHRALVDSALLDEARLLAGRLARGPTLAYHLIRQGVNDALTADLSGGLEIEKRNQRLAGFSHDAQEGVAAFLEKRPARFSGS